MIKILNDDFKVIDILRKYTFVQYEECFREIGSFKINAQITESNLFLLEKKKFYVLFDNDIFGEITKVEKDSDGEYEKTILIEGKMSLILLTRRVINSIIKFKGKTYQLVNELIVQNLTNDETSKRYVNIDLKYDNEEYLQTISSEVNKQLTGGYVWDNIYDLLEQDKMGIIFNPIVEPTKTINDIETNITRWEMKISAGVDRRKGNIHNNEAVVFSQSLSNIQRTAYNYETGDYKNVAYVAGEGEETNRKWYEIYIDEESKEQKGWKRKELWIDARDIQSEDGEKQLTDEEYETLIKQRANEKFPENSEIESYTATIVESNKQFIYGKDYFLGDLVTVIDNELGIEIDAQVTKVIISEQGNRRITDTEFTYGTIKRNPIEEIKIINKNIEKHENDIKYLENKIKKEGLVINAKSYGINGDGETDTSQLFTQLVMELNEKGGGIIYLPNGKYRLNSRITWKSNVSLIGESHNAILMPYCDNSVSQGFAAISWLNDDGSKQDGYDALNPFANCHFKNFTIDGINQNPSSYDSYPKGINIHFLKDCSFENLQFLNIFATGLGIDFLENVFIRNIYCYNCGRGYTPTSDEKIAGGAGIGIGTMGMEKESCIISDCITDGCGNYGIFLEGGSIFLENGCESHYTIANCQCINGRNYGIAVKGTDNVMVSNNIMRNNARDGFAMLYRPNRRCINIQIVGNLSASNSGCGYRFADGDGADYISEKIYIKNNVSEGNEKDGILISSILRNMFVENNIFESNDRAIAISSKSFQNLYFAGNRIRDCATNLVFDGLLDNTNLFNNQIVQMIGVHEKEYNSVYVDDSGMEIEHTSSKTTKDFTYCKGSLYCGFYFASSYEQTGTENRICYCHWYDENINFISREGAKVNGSGWKRFAPPKGACYVKYRVGINTGNLQNSQLKGVYLMRYMSDRCEIN